MDKITQALGAFQNVENYGGVKNQFLLHHEHGIVFQSYESIIVVQVGGKTYLGEHWDYSRTTSKYRNMFLRETTQEIKAKIDSGEYRMLEHAPKDVFLNDLEK